MTNTGESIRGKRSARNADLASERAKVIEHDQEPEAVETVDIAPGAAATWLRLQKGNPALNPWMSPVFVNEMWSQASDIEVPLLPGGIPEPSEIRRLREGCGLSVEQVGNQAQVGPDLWTAFEHGDTSVLHYVNANQLHRFVSAMAICVAAGGPPVPAAPEPVPEREPMRVVGAELLADLAREAGDRFGLAHVVLDEWLSVRIARGEVASPTLTDWPSEKEARKLIAAFPGLATRRRTVPWTSSSLLVDFMEQEEFTDQPFQARDELGVGKAGLLRVMGCMAAIVAADPDRVAAIDAEEHAADKRRQEQDAAALKARAAVAQANAIVAQAEAEKAAAGAEGAA